MPRQPKQSSDPLADKTFIIDNGAYTIKAGYSTPDPSPSSCTVVQNTIAHSARDRKTYIGADLEQCIDFGELAYRRPVQKGYIVNWETQKAVWEHSFFDSSAKLQVDPRETNLILTEAPNCMEALQTGCDQMVFECFEFASYYRCLSSTLNAYNDISSIHEQSEAQASTAPITPPECLLVIDTSYSHTTITPLYNATPLQSAIRRITVGGKLMTNYLKEQSSIRHFNVIDETHLLNDAKEAVAFVSPQFSSDLERVWKGGLKDVKNGYVDHSLVLDFVLPDYDSVKRGYIRPFNPLASTARARAGLAGKSEDVLPFANERFKTPELLFHPSDIGIQEAGIPEAVIQSLSVLPEGLRPAMASNIIVVGGNALIPGFMDRLSEEIRAMLPGNYPVRVSRPQDPITSTWLGGARLGNDRERMRELMVTKQEYEEKGISYLQRKFSNRG